MEADGAARDSSMMKLRRRQSKARQTRKMKCWSMHSSICRGPLATSKHVKPWHRWYSQQPNQHKPQLLRQRFQLHHQHAEEERSQIASPWGDVWQRP